MLDYDNSAFYYFAITLTTLYLVPGTYYFLKALYEGKYCLSISEEGKGSTKHLIRILLTVIHLFSPTSS